jgi:hypothetical protein
MKKILLLWLLLVAILCATYYCNAQIWTPNPKYIKGAHQDTTGRAQNKFQCYGTTQKGERCKRTVKADHDFCHQHATQKQ